MFTSQFSGLASSIVVDMSSIHESLCELVNDSYDMNDIVPEISQQHSPRRIDGFTGLSPKLMHYYAKVTHLCTRLQKNKTSEVIPLVGKAIDDQLVHFKQWSDLSTGHDTPDELLAACEAELDENGKATTKAMITLLVAESYVAALQIYLHCRLFRKSRRDPLVQQTLKNLIIYMDKLPTSGDLYTAQSPLASTFLGCLVMVEPEYREWAKNWFGGTTKSRGNVPPAWRAVRNIWDWLDARESDPELCENDQSRGWWEEAAEELAARE
ncbi:hypothetical protein K402DRAFT_424753 [Aulographum hederae CBS 113979]|uniref:Uncharacterized protein n=1 Tax=Aulographum hederae CBS 113979 TaxID=1176131 RepID=A0A6G1GN31_9PEZI|nr:hypothetical protein K402DRAFT_424753 [Aulographum hederae CBS 113979]